MNVKCVFWLYLQFFPETLLILRNERDIIMNVNRASLFSSDFSETWIFSTDLRKILGISNLMKNPIQWQSERRTWHLIVAFRKFANALKNYTLCSHTIYMFCTDIRSNSNFGLRNIKCLLFIKEMKSVYCAVRTGSLNKAVCASSLKS